MPAYYDNRIWSESARNADLGNRLEHPENCMVELIDEKWSAQVRQSYYEQAARKYFEENLRAMDMPTILHTTQEG